MRRIVTVVSQEEYNAWITAKKPFFAENIDGKVPPNKYTWWKGGENVKVEPKAFSVETIKDAKAGETLALEHINFATGSSKLTPESSSELDLIVDIMNKNPTMTVEISGHTDNVGDAVKNKVLSEARAKTVADYVAKKKIDVKRMTALGFGDEKPLVPNDSEANKLKNRRTEFKILTK